MTGGNTVRHMFRTTQNGRLAIRAASVMVVLRGHRDASTTLNIRKVASQSPLTTFKFLKRQGKIMILGVNTRVLLAGLVTVLICTSTSVGHAEEESISLMKTLAEWQYPDSKFNGATMSDGGNPMLRSIKCTAVLTTTDPVSEVIEFYTKSLDLSPDSEPAITDGKQTPAKARSVIVQDDSKDRPVAIHVIVVNQEKTSTTLVISRSETETETHISWLHYIRL